MRAYPPRMNIPRPHRVTLLIATLATLCLAGCAALPSSPSIRTPPPAPSTAPASPAGTTAASGPDTPLPVLATRRFLLEGGDVTVTINTFAQEGETLTLDFTVTNQSDESLEAFRFGAGKRPEVDGVYVLDEHNGRRHLPARAADGACVCSSTYGLAVHPKQALTFSAVFGALPEGVTSATVVIPLAGAFTDVPVTR